MECHFLHFNDDVADSGLNVEDHINSTVMIKGKGWTINDLGGAWAENLC